MTSGSGHPDGALIGFKSHLRPEVVPGDAVYLVSEHAVMALPGAEMAVLAPLLDGTRDLRSLLRETAPTLPSAQVGALIGRLTRSGLLDHRPPGDTGHPAGQLADAYWAAAGGEDVQRTARGPLTVRLVTPGGAADGPVRTACRDAGLTVTEDDRDAGLDLVVCTDYLDPALATLDAGHRAGGRPWLPVRPLGTTVWTGPVFRPGGPCWACLAHRLAGHRAAEAPLRARHDGAPPAAPHAALPVTAALGAGIAALAAAHWLAGRTDDAHDAVVTFDTLTLTTGAHRLTRRPQCPACGDPGLVAAAADRPVVLRARPVTPGTGGGHRSLTARQMWDRHAHLVDPVTGVVAAVRPDPRAPAGLAVQRAGHNLALGPRTAAGLRGSLRQESSGKGRDDQEARTGALCEAVERISGVWQGDERREHGSLRSLGERAIAPRSVQLWHDRQFADRQLWNAAGHPFHTVAEPFDPGAEIDWTPVWSPARERHVLLPSALLYFGVPDQRATRMLRADSNGCAAGGTLEDAALQGLLELVERDAVALWWYNMTRQPAVDLGSFPDPWIGTVLETHAGLGREVWALDLTADLGVPVVAAFSRRTDRAPQDIVFGFGAHPDPDVAVTRALSELNQLLPAVLEARADGTGYACGDPAALRWFTTAATGDLPYLLPDPVTAARTRSGYGYRPAADLRAAFDEVAGRIGAAGLEVLLLDQTRPDLGVPVVRVLVPGLRHFWPRYAPGRLYDVPVALGRLAAPTRYGALNPVPLFV